MALKKELEDLLAALPAEDQAPLRAQMEKHQTLRDGFLRQADYDRSMNEAKEAKAEFEEQKKEWQTWYDKAKPEFEDLAPKYEAVLKERDDLKAKVDAGVTAATGKESDVDVNKLTADVLKAVEGRGFVPKVELDAIIDAAAKKLFEPERNTLLKETLPAWNAFTLDVADIMMNHRQDFGKPLDRLALSKFMNENKLTDVKKGYEQFIAPEVAKKTEAKLRDDITKEVRSQFGVPGTSAALPTADEMGIVQRLVQSSDTKPDPAKDLQLGNGSIAALAAQEFAAEGKI